MNPWQGRPDKINRALADRFVVFEQTGRSVEGGIVVFSGGGGPSDLRNDPSQGILHLRGAEFPNTPNHRADHV